MDIVPLDFAAEPGRLAEYHALTAGVFAPGPRIPAHLFRLVAERGWRLTPAETWLAVDGGRVIGGVTLHLPDDANAHVALVRYLSVDAAHRRRGVGSTLLAHAADRARSQKRTMVLIELAAGSAGAAFARAKGMREVAAQARRVLDLTTFAPPEREIPGYRLEFLRGRSPEALTGDMITLMEVMNDAPLDDLAINDESWTPASMRQMEEAWDLARQDVFTVVARAADGSPAAFTRLFADIQEADGWGRQTDTAVLRAHRGRGLGRWVKEANTAWLKRARPDLTRVITWNAVSNGPMVAINERLGYRLLDVWNEWELRV
ncbi:GNAT family N-acetyltransferase [Herbidospora sp. NEAU-GS84]|uniref:GNAT family N-acetyltransferase n=1 Tax=Herbidospora solisilvae TaxID=2696284 RepID=A0A7C9JCP5_9ACTN|nr:GNAT family N-acetyltransferase [Herbidospora solisilvae]NAS23081.1 GNAT family N-acetyltransferase [Herbidospora solisilvae]